MRVFEKEKMVHLPSSQSESKSSEISLLSKEPRMVYGSRRTRIQNAQPSRQIRGKFDEPQCVTLSSDEDDDSFQDYKKLKSDGADKSCELTVSSPPKIFLQPNNEEGKQNLVWFKFFCSY